MKEEKLSLLGLRRSPHTETEIRLLAVEIARLLKRESPNIFHDVEVYDEAAGMLAVRGSIPKGSPGKAIRRGQTQGRETPSEAGGGRT